jgi:hypothetical protein
MLWAEDLFFAPLALDFIASRAQTMLMIIEKIDK